MKKFPQLVGLILLTSLYGEAQVTLNGEAHFPLPNFYFTMGRHSNAKDLGLMRITVTPIQPKGPVYFPHPIQPSVDIHGLYLPAQEIGYSQSVERSFVTIPGTTMANRVPYYLLMQPPPAQPVYPTIRVRRSRSAPER